MICPYCMNSVMLKKNNNQHGHTEANRENQMDSAEMRQQKNNNQYMCPECNRQIPREFAERRKNVPWTSIGMVGYSGHGKTVYITSLFYILRDGMINKRIWPDCVMMALDQESIKFVFKHVNDFSKGTLPEATRANFISTSLLQFKNTPHVPQCFISFYDVSGESYHDMENISQRANIVAKTKYLFFIVSLPKAGPDWNNKIAELLNTYVRGLDLLGLEPKKYQKLIVIFTLGDRLRDDLSEDLWQYLELGGYERYAEREKAITPEIDDISRKLENWLMKKEAGVFLNLANDSFLSVRYTLVSSTGYEPEGKKLALGMALDYPKRVLDPFMLVLDDVSSHHGRWRTLFRRFTKMLIPYV